MRWIAFILLTFTLSLSFGQRMRIGLMRSIKVKHLQIDQYQGQYHLFGDSIELGSLTSVKIIPQGTKVKITINANQSYVFSQIVVVQDTLNSAIKIKSISPASKQHYYRDNFEITNDKGRLRIVNLVDMNNYLGGVIESEGGGGRHIEYYKVQALMSRTYAMKNVKRHRKDGFELCDGVHCQAYHNMLRHTPKIQKAVEATRGEVIVDEHNHLISSYFAANCGGQTCEPSYVWNESVPFLSSFQDTFCIHTRQATWKKTVTKYSWKTFLEKEYGVLESKYGDLLYNFKQEHRKAFYIHPSLGIPLRDLRKKFRLKSTYFSTRLVGNEVIIEGRGFGHGIGLCQEGAMNMAKAGYNYRQIANFYFDNIRVVNYDRSKFLDQKGTNEIE